MEDSLDAKNTDIVIKLSEWYLGTDWLRIALQAVPYGGSFDYILGAEGRRIEKERIEHLLNSLGADLKALEQEKIDKTYLKSEDFFDLLTQALKKTTRIGNQEQINFIARIVRGAITGEVQAIADPKSLIDVLAELTADEALLLSGIYKMKPATGSFEDNLRPYIPEELFHRLQFLLKRVERTGLIVELTHKVGGAGYYTLTSTGKDLCDFVLSGSVTS